MALSSSTLSAAIKTNLLGSDPNVVDNDSLQDMCDAIAEAVVAHIQAAAEVPPGIALSTGGTTTGVGAVL